VFLSLKEADKPLWKNSGWLDRFQFDMSSMRARKAAKNNNRLPAEPLSTGQRLCQSGTGLRL